MASVPFGGMPDVRQKADDLVVSAVNAEWPTSTITRKLLLPQKRRSHWLVRAPLVFLVVATLLAATGCPGSNWWRGRQAAKTPEDILKEQEEREKKLKEAKEKPLVTFPIRVEPHDQTEPQFYVKPGHVTFAQQVLRANREDLQIDVRTRVLDRNNAPVDWPHTMYHLAWQRSIGLPKQQDKLVDMLFFVPGPPGTLASSIPQRTPVLPLDSSPRGLFNQTVPDDASTAPEPSVTPRYWLETNLDVKTDAALSRKESQPTIAMPDYQYHIVVLADVPDKYSFVKSLHGVVAPKNDFGEEAPPTYYRVHIPAKLDQYAPLASEWYGWTSTAYVFWDNISPNLLLLEQQQAMLDWLHAGGQLIISGPGSLEKLSGSFLEPYLPAARARAAPLTQEDFGELNAHWTVASHDGQRDEIRIQRTNLNGIQMEPAPHGRFVHGTGRLICEGDVGLGRIVITAFSLHERDLLRWPSYPSLWNAVLMGRPERVYRRATIDYLQSVTLQFTNRNFSVLSPGLATSLRYLSRDTQPILTREASHTQTPGVNSDDALSTLWRLDGYTATNRTGGIASWNDMSGVSQAARAVLRQASGIKVPSRSLVLTILATYIVLLVPVNWLFFRLVGRLEWAWLAAPVLAVGGSAIITRIVQLDIGFARSRIEVSLVEGWSGYSRAHQARYISLYSSLTTHYRIQSENASLLVAPLADDPPYQRRQYDPTPQLTIQRDLNVNVRGFSVASNSASMLHAEQMLDLGGTIEIDPAIPRDGRIRVINGTTHRIQDACIVGCDAEGNYYYSPPRTWDAGTELSVELKPLEPEKIAQGWASLWDQHPVLGQGEPEEATALRLQPLLEVAVANVPLLPNEWRMIGWTNHTWDDMKIQPAANQFRSATLFVIHLTNGQRPYWKPDANLYRDVVKEADQKLPDQKEQQ